MSSMTLYSLDLSPFSARVRIQIRAKGLENEIAIVDRATVGNFLEVSRTGKAPCLQMGDFALPESETIAEFIEDSFPEPPLRGHTAVGKAKVRLIARLVDLYLMPGFALLFSQMAAQPRDEKTVAEGLSKIDNALGLIEEHVEGTLFATQGRLTLADCALAPALFFCPAIQPAFGAAAFSGRAKMQTYFETISRDDTQVARVIGEMAAALQARMSGGR